VSLVNHVVSVFKGKRSFSCRSLFVRSSKVVIVPSGCLLGFIVVVSSRDVSIFMAVVAGTGVTFVELIWGKSRAPAVVPLWNFSIIKFFLKYELTSDIEGPADILCLLSLEMFRLCGFSYVFL
jgi:hypothetical protein